MERITQQHTVATTTTTTTCTTASGYLTSPTPLSATVKLFCITGFRKKWACIEVCFQVSRENFSNWPGGCKQVRCPTCLLPNHHHQWEGSQSPTFFSSVFSLHPFPPPVLSHTLSHPHTLTHSSTEAGRCRSGY